MPMAFVAINVDTGREEDVLKELKEPYLGMVKELEIWIL